MVKQIEWLEHESKKITDPHVLATWVKKFESETKCAVGETHSPSGQAGWGLGFLKTSLLAIETCSPSTQGGWGSVTPVYNNEDSRPRLCAVATTWLKKDAASEQAELLVLEVLK
jgi:hypothetical protein